MGIFDLAYRVGFAPWEDATRDFPVELDDFLMRTGLTPGRALDLGCGRGDHAITLAERGWDVVGIDYAARAVLRARKKARAAGVTARFVVGDVVELGEVFEDTGVDTDTPFGLVLDLGCFHGLSDAERRAYSRELEHVVGPGSRLLMLAFAPGRRSQLLRGADWAQMRADFEGWRLEGERPMAGAVGRQGGGGRGSRRGGRDWGAGVNADLRWIELERVGLRANR